MLEVSPSGRSVYLDSIGKNSAVCVIANGKNQRTTEQSCWVRIGGMGKRKNKGRDEVRSTQMGKHGEASYHLSSNVGIVTLFDECSLLTTCVRWSKGLSCACQNLHYVCTFIPLEIIICGCHQKTFYMMEQNSSTHQLTVYSCWLAQRPRREQSSR